MKRTSAKRDDGTLKFFTRELFLKGNSLENAVADDVEEQWEQAIDDYRKHLRAVKSKLPQETRALVKLALHDGELVGQPCMSASEQWGRIAVTGGWEVGESLVHLLRYELSAAIRRIHPSTAWPYSKRRVHWLYDELDVSDADNDGFIHRILLSDGSVVVVPFKNAQVQTWPSELLQDLALHEVAVTSKGKRRTGNGKAITSQAIAIE